MGSEEVMKVVVEKLKKPLVSMENLGGEALAWFDKGEREMGSEEAMKVVVEKLKEPLVSMENLGGEALAWFDKVFPPETRSDKINFWFHAALPYLIAALFVTVVVFLFRWCCGRCGGGMFRWCCGGGRFRWCCGGGRVKMMKAPGRNCRMRRSAFESDTKGYFRKLRAHPGDQFC